MKAAARKLAAAGFAVFPLQPRTKVPYPGSHGHLDATTDPDAIDAWPDDCNIGISCAASGIVVVDVDRRNAGDRSLAELEATLGPLPPTVTVRTQDGVHAYYRLPDGAIRKELAEGIDLKARGFVLAPPSVHPSGVRYAWLAGPDTPIATLPGAYLPHVVKSPDVAPETTVAPIFGAASLELLRHVRDHLAGFSGGAYDAACILVRDYALTLEEALPILYDWDASWSGGPRPQEWLIDRLKSAQRYGTGALGDARTMHLLLEATAPASRDVVQEDDDFLVEIRRAHADLLAHRTGGQSSKTPGPIFRPATSLLSADFPPTSWLVQGVVTTESVGAVAGEPKSDKTWAALELSVAIATNSPAFGKYSTGPRAHVALFLAEDSAKSVRNRLRALIAHRGMDPADVLEYLHFACREPIDLQDDVQLARLIASCRVLPTAPAMIVLDPMRDLHLADEDSSKDMADILGRLRALRDITGATVLFVHHSAKASGDVAKRRSGQKMRGSSAIHGAIDFGLYLGNVETDGQSNWTTTVECEIKAAQGAGLFKLDLHVEDDDHGEAILAEWNVRPIDAGNGDKAAADKEIDAVIKALITLGGSAKVKDIGPVAGVRWNAITRALAELEARGWVSKKLKGTKPDGWQLSGPILDRYRLEQQLKNQKPKDRR